MIFVHAFRLACLAAAVLLSSAVAGQSVSAGDKSFRIERTDKAPVVDGTLDDAEWLQSVRLSDLHEVWPQEFAPASERTEWFLSYDDQHLYVAANALDENPEQIVAQTMRQGASIRSDDSLHILLDAFNNKRGGYTFALNPNGVRHDAVYTNGTQQSDEWDGVWRGAAARTSTGWSMEMAIPFNTLTFNPDNATWGINLWREISRRNETIAWSSRNGRVNPTVSGEVTGFRDLSQGLGFDVIPSISSTYFADHDEDDTDSDFEPSLDINYKVGSSLNALLTINTDFAATEVDDRQLGLQRFSLFFPEKRSFFLTDFDIFQFGGVPTGSGRRGRQTGLLSGTNGLAFFSRRIGLSSSREPVDLSYGTKISGRLGRFDFGTLYIRQDEYEDSDTAETVDATDIVVARVTRSFLEQSSFGLIYTDGDPESNDDSSLVGADFLYRNTRLGNNRTLDVQAWLQKSNNPGVNSDDRAFSAIVSMPSRTGFEAGAQIQVIEENFHPALGFANRVGVRLYGFEAGYQNMLEDREVLQEVSHAVSYSRWEYLDTGRVQSEEVWFQLLDIRSKANDTVRLSYSHEKEGLLPGEEPLDSIGILIPPGEYSFNRYGISLRTSGHRHFSLDVHATNGGYYNGDRLQISPEIEWVPNRHLRFALGYSYNKYDFPGVSTVTRQIAIGNDIAFNANASLSTLIQYDNISDDIGINTRFRYNVAAGRDIWLVLNHNMVEDPADDRFHSTQTTAAVKLRFTFRY